MTEQEISNALRERLYTMNDAPAIVWENAPGAWSGTEWETPAPPFFVVSQVKAPPVRMGLLDNHVFSGRLVVSIMTQVGSFTEEGERLAEAVVARFAPNTQLTAGTGTVTIIERPQVEDGYNDGAYWRVNVGVRWQAA